MQMRFGATSCFQAGCVLDVLFPDRASYELAARAFRTLRDANGQHGGRV
jgi:hypothetical protein